MKKKAATQITNFKDLTHNTNTENNNTKFPYLLQNNFFCFFFNFFLLGGSAYSMIASSCSNKFTIFSVQRIRMFLSWLMEIYFFIHSLE